MRPLLGRHRPPHRGGIQAGRRSEESGVAGIGLAGRHLLTHEFAFFGKEVVHQFLLDFKQLASAASKGRTVSNLVMTRVEITQHQLDRIQGCQVLPGAWGCGHCHGIASSEL